MPETLTNSRAGQFTLSLLILVFATGITMTTARAENWKVTDASSIQIQFKQFGSTEQGTFNRFTPKIEFDTDNPEVCQIDVTIDLASIDSGSVQRDDIMKSADFFKTGTYPEASFSSAKCKSIGGNAYEAYGELTIRDITRPVMLPFTLDFEKKGSVLTASAKGELPLSRFDYDLGNSTFWRNSGIVGRVIRIYLDIEAKIQSP